MFYNRHRQATRLSKKPHHFYRYVNYKVLRITDVGFTTTTKRMKVNNEYRRKVKGATMTLLNLETFWTHRTAITDKQKSCNRAERGQVLAIPCGICTGQIVILEDPGAEQTEGRVCGRSVVGLRVRSLSVLSVVCYQHRSLRRVYRSSRAVLPAVVCHRV